MLQLHQLLTHSLVCQHLIQLLPLVAIEIEEDVVMQGQRPPHQGSLTNGRIGRPAVDRQQHLELCGVEVIEGGQHDGTGQHLLIVDINRGREQDFLHGRGLAFAPDGREPETVKPVGNQLLMPTMQLFLLLHLRMFRFKGQHRTGGHKLLQSLFQRLDRPVMRRETQTRMNTRQIGGMLDLIGHVGIGIEHIQPTQEIIVEMG